MKFYTFAMLLNYVWATYGMVTGNHWGILNIIMFAYMMSHFGKFYDVIEGI